MDSTGTSRSTTGTSTILAHHDKEQFVPAKLYGRSEEQAILIDAYRNKFYGRNQEIILISGRSGTGKTALAQALGIQAVNDGGMAIIGKCDQLQQPEPYAPFVAAFLEFTHLVVNQGLEEVQSMKEDIEDALDPSECQLLTDAIPALHQILGESNESLARVDISDILKGSDVQQKRVHIVFRKFINAICSSDIPIILILDDLQWADACSLGLFKNLATAKDNDGLMILVTRRCNEAGIKDPLTVAVQEIKDQNVSFQEIEVGDLNYEALNRMLSDILKLSEEECESFSKILFHKTSGNTFFTLQLLQSLSEEGILRKDAHSQWTWDEVKLQQMHPYGSAVSMVRDQFHRLPPDAQEVLSVAACMGAQFDAFLIGVVLSRNVTPVLKEALRRGFVAPGEGIGVYKFTHDSLQTAAKVLIPEEELERFHSMIGMRLWKGLSKDELDKHINLVVNQLSHISNSSLRKGSKYGVAKLCLRAGRKAVVASAFETGAIYLRQGIQILGNSGWSDPDLYDICLELHNMAAEAACCHGNHQSVDIVTTRVLDYTRDFHDQLRAYTTRVYSLGARKKFKEAITTGLQVLKRLGEPLPASRGKMRITITLAKTMLLLRNKSNIRLLGLPSMVNKDKLAAMQMLNLICPYAFGSEPSLAPLLSCCMVRLTLRFGISAMSSVAFSSYGLLLVGIVGDVDEGYRYGQLALEMVELFQIRQWVPRINSFVFGFINIWKQPFHKSIGPLLDTHRLGLQLGDVEASCFVGAYTSLVLMLTSGMPLTKVKETLLTTLKVSESYEQEYTSTYIKSGLPQVLYFLGELDIFPYSIMNKEIEENPRLILDFFRRKIWLAYTFNNFILAGETMVIYRTTYPDLTKIKLMVPVTAIMFDGLSATALANKSNEGKQKQQWVLIAKACLKAMKKYANTCPVNFLNKLRLMEAEFASMKGNRGEALLKYKESIELAREQGILHEEALACERAGQTMRRFGMDTEALVALAEAKEAYKKWGSIPKVAQIDEMVSNIAK